MSHVLNESSSYQVVTMDVQNADDTIQKFRVLVSRLTKIPMGDLSPRDITLTPYEGAYGHAGVVITINGSPPRGVFLADCYSRDVIGPTSTVVFYYDYRSRLLGKVQAEAVWALLDIFGHTYGRGCDGENVLQPLIITHDNTVVGSLRPGVDFQGVCRVP